MINLPIAKEYGIVETKAQEISEMFKPMLDKIEVLEKRYNEVIGKEITPELSKQAKRIRLDYVAARGDVTKIHKTLKAFYLQGGKFVDGWKNTFIMATQGNEASLKEIEKHAEIEAQKVINALQLDRGMELEKYEITPIPGSLGEMKVDMWNAYLAGVKSNYETIKEAERKAKQDRINKEKAEAEEQARIKAENEKLKVEQAELKEKAEAERKERERVEFARIKAEEKKAEELRIIQQKEAGERAEIARIEREKHEAELAEQKRKSDELQRIKDEESRVIREEQDRKLAKSKAERERMEKELKAKADKEEQELVRIEAEKQAELSKGDSAKVQDMIADFQAIANKYKFDSERNQATFCGVCNLISKVIAFINK